MTSNTVEIYVDPEHTGYWKYFHEYSFIPDNFINSISVNPNKFTVANRIYSPRGAYENDDMYEKSIMPLPEYIKTCEATSMLYDTKAHNRHIGRNSLTAEPSEQFLSAALSNNFTYENEVFFR